MAPKICHGFLCTYLACDFDDIKCLAREQTEFLCITHGCCIAIDDMDNHMGMGVVTDESKGEICKIGLVCCNLGLKTPQTCIAGTAHCLCMKEVVSLPCTEEYLNEPVCAICCLSLAPNCGCCVEAPKCPAMER